MGSVPSLHGGLQCETDGMLVVSLRGINFFGKFGFAKLSWRYVQKCRQ